MASPRGQKRAWQASDDSEADLIPPCVPPSDPNDTNVTQRSNTDDSPQSPRRACRRTAQSCEIISSPSLEPEEPQKISTVDQSQNLQVRDVLQQTKTAETFPQARQKRALRSFTLPWTTQMEYALLQTLLEQARLGRRTDNGFRPEVWNYVVPAVQKMVPPDEHGEQMTVSQDKVSAKLYDMKLLFREYLKLMELPEFRWDKNRRMVIASEEVWFEHAKLNKKAKRLRNRSLPYIDLLHQLFDDIVTTEQPARIVQPAVTFQLSNNKLPQENTQEIDNRGINSNKINDPSRSTLPDCFRESGPGNIPHDTLAKKSRETTSGDSMATILNSLIQELAAARMQRLQERETPIEKAYKILVELYKDDPKMIVKSGKVLEKGTNAYLFLAAQGEMRKLILDQLLENPT